MSANGLPRVAILGLGIIGSRAHARLVDAGWDVACWNRTPKGTVGEAASAAEAIRGRDLVSIYLKDAPAVREVIESLRTQLQPGQIVLNHATVDLETTRHLAAVCADAGCRFLDCPFTGSKLAAAGGQLVYYIGGDAALAESLEAYLSVTSRARMHCGDVGSATVIKLSTNLLSACVIEAAAEALAISTRHGVSAEHLIRAIAENVSSSALTTLKLPLMAAGDFETHFSLANMGKDTRYMLELVRDAGIETPAIAAVSRRIHDLCDAGLGGLDYSALAQPYLDRP